MKLQLSCPDKAVLQSKHEAKMKSREDVADLLQNTAEQVKRAAVAIHAEAASASINELVESLSTIKALANAALEILEVRDDNWGLVKAELCTLLSVNCARY